MSATTPTKIGPYVDLVPLPGSVNLFVGRESRFPSDEFILVKVFRADATGAFSSARFLEPKLLRRLESPRVPRLGTAGHDGECGVHYYSMIWPAPMTQFVWEDASMSARLQAVARVAEAVSELHQRGIVYRNFHWGAIGFAERVAVLYDLSRAAEVGADGMVSGFSRLESFDPPEASRQRYGGWAGDIYGLGVLARDVGVDAAEVAALLGRMVDVDATRRPRSIGEVREALGEAAKRCLER